MKLMSLILAGALLIGQAFASTETQEEADILNTIIETVAPFVEGENEAGTLKLMGAEAAAVYVSGFAYRSAIREKNNQLLKLLSYHQKLGLTELIKENRALQLYVAAEEGLKAADADIKRIQGEIDAIKFQKEQFSAVQKRFTQRKAAQSMEVAISNLVGGTEGSIEEAKIKKENFQNTINHKRAEVIKTLREQKNLRTFSGKAFSIRTLRVLAAAHLLWMSAEVAYFNAIDEDDAIMYGVALPSELDEELGISESLSEAYNDVESAVIEFANDISNK